MSTAEKLTTVAQKVPQVYEAGFACGYKKGHTDGAEWGYKEGATVERKAFWDNYQDSGNRRNHNYAFAGIGWTDETYDPAYPIICTSAATMYGNSKITSTKVPIDWSEATTTTYAFSACSSMVIIPLLIVSETTKFAASTFNGLTNLESMTLQGTIGQDGFDVSKSTKLNKASHVNAVGCISTTASVTVTFSKVAVDKAFETAPGANDGSASQEWNDLVDTRPNATIVLA